MEISDEKVPIEHRASTFGEQHLQEWLRDKKGRDQFLILEGLYLEVYWNIWGKLKPELVDYRIFSFEFVNWSPLGSYVATVDRQGPSIWGGATFFNPLMRYHHPRVELIDFSPGENYLVSYSSCQESIVLKIFDVKTGKLKIDIQGNEKVLATGGTEGVSGVLWPVIRWSGQNDDKYFARVETNAISIYETETFTLIDNKPLRVENVADFSWSPGDPILALFVPANDTGSQPSMVSLIQIPSKMELRKKNLIGVNYCKMYWQSDGDYLAVMLNQATGTSEHLCFVIFNMRDPGIPSVELELENKNDKTVAFAWEPKGDRFAIIHGVNQRPNLSFYSMLSAQNRRWVSKIITLEGMQVNSLYWSPAGRLIVLAGLEDSNGQLIFYDVDALEILASKQFMARHIEWSPTGWYVATSGTLPNETSQGVEIWSFCGEILYQIPRSHFKQFLWRPKPTSYLSSQNKEEIAKFLEKKTEEDEELFPSLDDQELFILSGEQCSNFTHVPEGWKKWMTEWIRLGKLMLGDEKSNAEVKEQERMEEKLDK